MADEYEPKHRAEWPTGALPNWTKPRHKKESANSSPSEASIEASRIRKAAIDSLHDLGERMGHPGGHYG